MKKRVVPAETVENFIALLKILFCGQTQQPDYNGLRKIFLEDSFEVECEEPKEDNEDGD